MVLDHERLDVYAIALDFLVFANEVIERLPRGRGHLADQLTRASTSIVLNLAEGAGKLSKADKRRYYLTARGSATESAALLDVCSRLRLIGEADYRTGKAMIVRQAGLATELLSAATKALPRRSCDCPSAGGRLVAPSRAPFRSSPTAAHQVDVEPSWLPMDHRFETMDSACSMHSNFRPPQNDEPRATDSLAASRPCPCPRPCPISLSETRKIGDRP